MLWFAVGQNHAGEGLNGRSFLTLLTVYDVRSVSLSRLRNRFLVDFVYYFSKCTRAPREPSKHLQFAYQRPADIDCRAACIIKDVRCS